MECRDNLLGYRYHRPPILTRIVPRWAVHQRAIRPEELRLLRLACPESHLLSATVRVICHKEPGGGRLG